MDDIKTYFALGTVFEGTVTSSGDILVDGEVKGEIVSEGKVSIHKMGDMTISAHDLELLGASIKGDITVKGEVIVDKESAVQGNIRSSSIICGGSVMGNLAASESISLGDHAKVVGNINAPIAEINPGARVRGQLLIGSAELRKGS